MSVIIDALFLKWMWDSAQTKNELRKIRKMMEHEKWEEEYIRRRMEGK